MGSLQASDFPLNAQDSGLTVELTQWQALNLIIGEGSMLWKAKLIKIVSLYKLSCVIVCKRELK